MHFIKGYWSILPRMFVYYAFWFVLEYIFRELSLRKIYMNIISLIIWTWAPALGRARVGARPPSLSLNKLFRYLVAFFATFSPYGGLFHHVGAFCYFFSLWGAFYVLMGSLFWAPSTKVFTGAHEHRYGIAAYYLGV